MCRSNPCTNSIVASMVDSTSKVNVHNGLVAAVSTVRVGPDMHTLRHDAARIEA
jgi:hypothetical protein